MQKRQLPILTTSNTVWQLDFTENRCWYGNDYMVGRSNRQRDERVAAAAAAAA